MRNAYRRSGLGMLALAVFALSLCVPEPSVADETPATSATPATPATATTSATTAAPTQGAVDAESLVKRNKAVDLFNAGVDLLTANKMAEAKALFDQSIEADPSFPHPYLNRAVCRSDANDMQGAREDYDRCILLMPEMYQAYNGRGLLSQAAGDYKGSIVDFTKAISLCPKRINYYLNRANSYGAMNNLTAAKADIEHALKLEPSSKWAQEALRDLNLPKSGFHTVTTESASPSTNVTARQQAVESGIEATSATSTAPASSK